MKEKLIKGQIFKNYNKICEWLGVKPSKNGGNTKIAHIKEFERYCKYHKEGQKYIVDEVYDEPLEKIDGRVNNKGGNNNKYSDLMDNAIVEVLKKGCIMDSKSKIFCDHIPLFKMTEYSGYYSRSLDGLSIYYKTTKHLVKTYYDKMLDMTTKCFERSLKRLKKQGIINYEIGITTITYIGEMDYVSPNDVLFKKIKAYEKETLKEMKITPYDKVINRNKNVEFKEIMKEKLEDVSIKQRDNISNYWTTYNIELANDADKLIDLDSVKSDVEELRKQLIINLHTAIINHDVRGKTPYDQPKYMKDILYIDSKIWIDAKKLIDDVDIGFTLAYYELNDFRNNEIDDKTDDYHLDECIPF